MSTVCPHKTQNKQKALNPQKAKSKKARQTVQIKKGK